MNATDVKKQLVGKIDKINDPQTLENLGAIVDDLLAKSFRKDFWNDIAEALQKGIEKAEKDLNDWKGIPHQNVSDEIKKRFNR